MLGVWVMKGAVALGGVGGFGWPEVAWVALGGLMWPGWLWVA